jgi:hypothetical protein
MEHNLAKYAKYYYGNIKILDVEFTRKIDYSRRDFLDISKQILKSSYTLNLGQLLKIVRVKKVYLAKAKTRKNLKSKENNHRETS